jgi:hypothetical protein
MRAEKEHRCDKCFYETAITSACRQVPLLRGKENITRAGKARDFKGVPHCPAALIQVQWYHRRWWQRDHNIFTFLSQAAKVRMESLFPLHAPSPVYFPIRDPSSVLRKWMCCSSSTGTPTCALCIGPGSKLMLGSNPMMLLCFAVLKWRSHTIPKGTSRHT